jgi:hypothetical protein
MVTSGLNLSIIELLVQFRRWFGKENGFENAVSIEVLKDEAHEFEQSLKNRMRFNKRCKGPWLGKSHIHFIRLSRLQLIVNRSQGSCRDEGCEAHSRPATVVLVRHVFSSGDDLFLVLNLEPVFI